MSIIKDTFFGGAEKKAAQASVASSREAQEFIRQGQQQARADILPLFGASGQNLLTGAQGALDIFSQSLPAQTQAFQQGIGGAQQSLLAGLPQIQQALLGGQVDFSALQPQEFQQPDLSFFNQQLPDFQTTQQIFQVPEPSFVGPQQFPSSGGSFGGGFDFGGLFGGGGFGSRGVTRSV